MSAQESGRCQMARLRAARLKRRGRRQDDAEPARKDSSGADQHADAPVEQFEMTRFTPASCELVAAGPGNALLRVTGSWTGSAPHEVELFVAAGENGMLVKPLPPGPGLSSGGAWSVAFPFEPGWAGRRCALTTRSAGVTVLPAPAETLAARGPDELGHALEELEEARALADQFRRRCELSERALHDFRDKLVQAWGESASMRDMLDERESAHDAARKRAREADAAIATAEARAAASRRELDERRAEMETQCARLEQELAEH